MEKKKEVSISTAVRSESCIVAVAKYIERNGASEINAHYTYLNTNVNRKHHIETLIRLLLLTELSVEDVPVLSPVDKLLPVVV